MDQGKISYHVFLSLKPQDTGNTFTDHLHRNLVQAGFHVFKCDNDDEKEKIGDLKPKFKKGIEQSRMSVIVLSQNYASSEWCLDELVMILEQKRNFGHIVLPVFFDVDPSDVRKQKGCFGEENFRIVNCEESEEERIHKVKSWSKALKEVADLGGMPLQNQANGFKGISLWYCAAVDSFGTIPALGNFKLEALENADPQMLKHFGLNLETMENAMVKMDLFSSYKMKMLPPQGLYEQGIFSTFLPGNKIPSWFTKLENINGVSFTISQPLNNVQGLSIAVVYTSSESQENEFSRAYFLKQENIVHNTTKDLKWMHHPRVFGVPEGNEEITWLSHWKFGELLQDGDEISISVRLNNLKVKELGIGILCDEQQLSELSNCKVASSAPIFSNENVPGDVSQRGRVFNIGR